MVHNDGSSDARYGISREGIGSLPGSAIIEVPRRVIQDRRLCIAIAGLVHHDGFCGILLASGLEIFRHTCGVEPRGKGDQGIVLAHGEVAQSGRVGGDILFLQVATRIRLQVGDEEEAIGIVAGVGVLGGKGLDGALDVVLKAEGAVERVELVVVIVDIIGIGKVNGEDANTLGGCV